MAPPPRPNTDSREDGGQRLITVLVTGFGPFQARYPVNPSYEIARSLPKLLPQSSVDCEAVRIISYGSPIRVCYEDARKIVPQMHESYEGTVDLVLHIGMASGRKYYSAERYAHRDDYGSHKDIDGQAPTSEEALELYGDCPALMTTSLDYETMVENWQSSVRHTPAGSPAHGADCRASYDAGHFLCDYTYLNSLAWYGRKSKKYEGGGNSDRPVMFLHVPAESDETMLDKGRAVAVALIRAMVDGYVGAT